MIASSRPLHAAALAALVCLTGACAPSATSPAPDPTPDPAPAAQPALDPAPDPADVASIDAIVGALYDVISGPVGAERDWDRFRSLFHPSARLIATGRMPDGTPAMLAMSPEEYIENNARALVEIGFVEREIGRTTDHWGRIAQVFSSYEAFRDGGDTPFMRGINSFQLWNDADRWWVLSIFWQQESPDEPIPERYLDGARR